MTGHRVRLALVLALLVATALSGCLSAPDRPTSQSLPTTATAAPCTELAARIVEAVQAYVDSFGDVRAGDVTGAVSARQAEFSTTTTGLAARGRTLGCDANALASDIRRGLSRLTGGTPVQAAIADTFRADPLGSIDPSDAGPSRIRVRTAQELVTAVARAGSGSTILLAAGTYALRSPLVTLRPITLSGAGDGTDPRRMTTTTITSTAAGAALMAATGGNLALTDLAIEHQGPAVASVVIVAAGGYRFERVRLSGGVAKDGAGGFGLILRPSSRPLTPTGDARSLTDLRLDRNAGGGIVVAGSEQPAISRVAVTGASSCGVCWVEGSGGTATDVSVEGGDIGLRVETTASVQVTRARTTGATVGLLLNGSGATWLEDSVLSGGTIGIQSTGAGTLNVAGSRVAGAREIAVRLSGTTRATLDRVTLSGATRIGIATVGQAASTLTGSAVSSTGEVGLVWGENALGTMVDVVVRGAGLGLQLGGSATVVGSHLVVDRSAAAAVLAGGTTTGVISGLTCGRGGGAAVVFAQSTTLRLQDSPGCRTVRQ